MTAVLNYIFKKVRIAKAVRHIKDNSTVLDIGSGLDAQMLLRIQGRIRKGIGLDYRTRKFAGQRIEVRKYVVKDKLPFKNNSFDHITMLAMIEHLKYPKQIVKECKRILKPGGSLIITTPTPAADKILHVLLKMPAIFSDEEEASLHETCFTHMELRTLLFDCGFDKVKIKRFELGLNTLAIGYK